MPKRSHSQMWQILKRGMGDRWDACRHECSATVGVPDISYACGGTNGWIEMKSIPQWPIGKSVKIKDLSVHQVQWMANRSTHGSNRCFILVSVGEDWVLTNAEGARQIYEIGFPARRNVPEGWVVWNRTIGWTLLLDCLTWGLG